jgi:peroxiredoxin
MKKLIFGLALGAALAGGLASPSFAALKAGDTAPDFTAQGSLGGKPFTFNLKTALRKGPVVVYFYPSAYTGGCDLEAHTFAEESDKFAAAGGSILGVSADNLERLHQFSADPAFCAGKFPIASDADTKIAQSYDLNVGAAREGAKDVRGVEIGHAFIERVTYVIGKDGKIIAALSSKTDGLSPDQHVTKSLAIVAAAK